MNLEGQYKTLRAGTTEDPMALSISASELQVNAGRVAIVLSHRSVCLQEDMGYSKDSEADDTRLVSDDGEL